MDNISALMASVQRRDTDYAVRVLEELIWIDEFRSLQPIPPQLLNVLRRVMYFTYDNRNLRNIPESIGELENLHDLRLEGNRLQTLPRSIGNLLYLRRLFVNDNLIHSLPDEIGNLPRLRSLRLGNNNIQTIPASVGNLTALEQLHLNNNNILSLPEEIGNLRNLKVLEVQNNYLTSLPNNLRHLENLRELNIQYNVFTEQLPEFLCTMPQLTELNVYGNPFISTQPDCIVQLTEDNFQYLPIEYLSIDNSKSIFDALRKIEGMPPENIPQRLLNKLSEVITLSYNHIGQMPFTFPENIGLLTNLTEFTIRSDNLGLLPESICSLAWLQRLVVQGNSPALFYPNCLEGIIEVQRQEEEYSPISSQEDSTASDDSADETAYEINKAKEAHRVLRELQEQKIHFDNELLSLRPRQGDARVADAMRETSRRIGEIGRAIRNAEEALPPFPGLVKMYTDLPSEHLDTVTDNTNYNQTEAYDFITGSNWNVKEFLDGENPDPDGEDISSRFIVKFGGRYYVSNKDDISDSIVYDNKYGGDVVYECPNVGSMTGIVRDVPYANLKVTGNSLIIPLGQLKTILEDSNVNAIEIDEMAPPKILNSLASYQMTFVVDGISDAVSALHCQSGNSTNVYRARKITFDNPMKRRRLDDSVAKSETVHGGGGSRRRCRCLYRNCRRRTKKSKQSRKSARKKTNTIRKTRKAIAASSGRKKRNINSKKTRKMMKQ